MRPSGAEPRIAQVVPDMFHTSARVRHLVRLLRPLPSGLGETILAGAAMVDGLVRPARFRDARAWAAAQPAPGARPWRLALALLANHGRFCAEEALLGVSATETPSPDVIVEGAERLPEPGTGAILLVFHLGPPRVWWHLRSLGYPVKFGGRLSSSPDARWNAVVAAGEVVRVAGEAPADRLAGLVQMRDRLRSGGLLVLSADGPVGREAFRLDLPGGPLIVRAGWLALRRLTGAPTFPLLAHRDGRRRVIVVHPALPPWPGDVARDAAQCQAALTPLLESYVRRFPSQCRYLAFPPWSSAPGDLGALDSEGDAT